MNPTSRELAVLRLMQRENTAILFNALTLGATLAIDLWHFVPVATVASLAHGGYLRRDGWRGGEAIYSLTDAGRRAITEARELAVSGQSARPAITEGVQTP